MIQIFKFPNNCPACGERYIYSDEDKLVIILVDGAHYLRPKFVQCPRCKSEAPLKREITKK